MEKVILNSMDDYHDFCIKNVIGDIMGINGCFHTQRSSIIGGERSRLSVDMFSTNGAGRLIIRARPKSYPCMFVWQKTSEFGIVEGAFVYLSDFNENYVELLKNKNVMEKKIKKFGELNDGDFVYFVYNGKFRNVSTSIVAQIVHGGCSNVVFDSVKPDSSSETFPARFKNDIEVYVTTSFQDATDKFEEITGSAPNEVIMDIDDGMRMLTSEFKKIVYPTEEEHKDSGSREIEEFLFGLVGVFNHYEFFTKELWRNAPGFRNKDEAEVKCAFMHKWRNEEFGGYTSTCGCDWFDEVSKESFDSYIKEYAPVFEMYKEWMEEQR